jgi:hypothetical protein
MLTFVFAPPAAAAPIQNAPGLAEAQANIDLVQYRRYRGYRHGPRVWYGPRRAYRYWGPGPYVYGYPYAAYPYAYAYPPRYYRRYYRGPVVSFGVGPFGFGVW